MSASLHPCMQLWLVLCMYAALLSVQAVLVHAAGNDTTSLTRRLQTNELDERVEMNCILPKSEQYQVQHWVLNDNTTISDSTDAITLSDNRSSLVIHSLQWSHYGNYYCYLQHQEEETGVYITYRLTTRGEDRWSMYKTNTLVGCVAAGGMLVVTLAIYLVYRYRWQPSGDDPLYLADETHHGKDSTSQHHYSNHAYDMEAARQADGESTDGKHNTERGVYIDKVLDTRM